MPQGHVKPPEQVATKRLVGIALATKRLVATVVSPHQTLVDNKIKVARRFPLSTGNAGLPLGNGWRPARASRRSSAVPGDWVSITSPSA